MENKKKGTVKAWGIHAFTDWCFLTTTISLDFFDLMSSSLLNTLNKPIYKDFRVQVLTCIFKQLKKSYVNPVNEISIKKRSVDVIKHLPEFYFH